MAFNGAAIGMGSNNMKKRHKWQKEQPQKINRLTLYSIGGGVPEIPCQRLCFASE